MEIYDPSTITDGKDHGRLPFGISHASRATRGVWRFPVGGRKRTFSWLLLLRFCSGSGCACDAVSL